MDLPFRIFLFFHFSTILLIGLTFHLDGISLVSQKVKNLPAMQETLIRSLGQEDPLEKGMVTHSSILAWRIPRTEETGKLVRGVTKTPWWSLWSHKELDTTERLNPHTPMKS